MLRRRIIPCLDVHAGRVVKGVQFVDLVDEGDPVELAERYVAEGADEICFLDITASSDGRETMLDVVRRTAQNVFVPLSVGGGVRSVADMRATLRAGADKVVINTAALADPDLIDRCAAEFRKAEADDPMGIRDPALVRLVVRRDAFRLEVVSLGRLVVEQREVLEQGLFQELQLVERPAQLVESELVVF